MTKFKNIRLIPLMLAFFMLCTVWGCSGTAETADAGTEGESTAAGETGDTALADNLPEADYEGASFRTLTRRCCPSHKSGLYTEEDSGDVIENAVYTRNRMVEERFNITVEEPLTDSDAMPERLVNAILAVDDIADAATIHFRYLGSMAVSGYLAELSTVPYFDFDRIWWATDMIDNYSAYGRVYILQGCLDIDNITDLGALYFNKTLLENTSPGTDLYAMTANGEWTIDEMTTLVERGGADLDGDGIYSHETDQTAYAGYAGHSSLYQYAMNQPTTERDENGVLQLVINTEKMVDIADKIYYMSKGCANTYIFDAVPETIFTDGNTLFYINTLNSAINAGLRAMDADYGIVPLPKYNTEQDRYYSHAMAHSSLIGVPVTNNNLEFTAVILEAMTAEGYKTVRPALYKNALTVKGVRDEESIEMIDIILAGRTSDFADIYDEWGLAYSLDHLVRGNASSFATYYAAQSVMEQRLLDKALEFYAG